MIQKKRKRKSDGSVHSSAWIPPKVKHLHDSASPLVTPPLPHVHLISPNWSLCHLMAIFLLLKYEKHTPISVPLHLPGMHWSSRYPQDFFHGPALKSSKRPSITTLCVTASSLCSPFTCFIFLHRTYPCVTCLYTFVFVPTETNRGQGFWLFGSLLHS